MKLRGWLVVGAAVLLAAAVVAALCTGWRSARIPDVTRPADLSLAARAHDGWPAGFTSGVSIHVTGEIDGEAEVWADGWEPQRLAGQVDWRVDHDWFLPDCLIYYRPKGVSTGRLVIRYQFH